MYGECMTWHMLDWIHSRELKCDRYSGPGDSVKK